MPKPTTKKTKKLTALTETHAAVQTSQLTTLDQVWGFNESARYGTIDEVEYSAKLKDMTRSDLENHCRAVGAMVLENSERMREQLLKQFRGYIASLRKPNSVGATIGKSKISPAVQSILNEGR